MKKLIIIMLAITALLLCACGAVSASAPTPVPTPIPTPEPTPMPVEYTLTDESAEEILALAEINTLKYIDASASREYAALTALQEKLPDCRIYWEYELQGETYTSETEAVKVTSLEGVEDALRYLPKLNYLDVIETDADINDLDRFYDIRPDVFYYWSFDFDGFRIRTDIECYSTLRGLNYYRFTDEDFYPMFKYCRKMKALDVGHNNITDVSWIGKMTDLEVLILADNPNLVDASPLKNLNKLIYLEFFMNHKVESYDFLYEMPLIKDLNLCYCDNLGTLDFLGIMPDMTFGVFKFSGITQENFDYWKAQYPDAELVLDDGSPWSIDNGWRDTQRNHQIRYAFTNWRHVVNYPHYDCVEFNFDDYNYKYYKFA